MNLKDIMAISGLPGLYKMVTSRNNGLLVANMDTGKTKFCSVRKHQFTPLGSIAIYTIVDTIPLKDVLSTMHEQKNDIPLPAEKADKSVLQEYFVQIVPQYDTERVYASDIKKLVKWFRFLEKHELMDAVLAEESTDEEE